MTLLKATQNTLTVLAILATVASFAITFLSYDQLPDSVVIHFGFSGVADGWAARPLVYLLPVVLGMVEFFFFWQRPRLSARKFGALLPLVSLELALFFLYLQWMIIQCSMGLANGVNQIVVLAFVLSLAFTAAAGRYLSARSR